jgi:hypothetical protein
MSPGDEPFPHLPVFPVFLFPIRRDAAWFQGHAAFRAVAGMVLHHLRVHGAGVLGSPDRFRIERFQRHAALGARSWPLLPHLRVHRAGIDAHLNGSARRRRPFCGFAADEAFRIGFEFRQAMITAEVIGLPPMLMADERFFIPGAHPANRIDILRPVIMGMMVGMVVIRH